MSGAKSILEIDVKDEKWRAFQQEFSKYHDAVKDLPGDWGNVGKATGALTPNFADMVRLLGVMAENLAHIEDYLERGNELASGLADDLREAADSGGKLNNSVGFAAAGMGKLHKDARGLAGSIAETTLSLIRWTGITAGVGAVMGGLAGVGGLWGLDRLGAGAAGMGRAAMGLGVTPGEQSAFRINFKPAVDDPDSLLSGVADAKNDQSKWALFASLGIKDFKNRDAADLAPDVLASARRLYQQNPSAQWMHARGVDQLLSMPDWRRIGTMSDQQFAGMRAGFQRDRKGLDIDGGTLQKWQEFTTQMQRASAEIEKTFITGLAPLAPTLATLSSRFSDVVASFLKAPEVKEGLDDLSDGLKNIAAWLKGDNTPWNNKDKTPVIPAEEAAHPTAFGRWLYSTFDRLRDPTAGDTWLSRKIMGAESSASSALHWLALSSAKGLETWDAAKAGLPDGFAQKIFKQEDGLNPDGSPRISAAGAIGAGQLMPETARDLGVDPFDTSQNIEGTVRYMAQMLKRYGGDQMKAAAAYNWGPGNLDKDVAAHGTKWADYLPKETADYIKPFGGGRLPAAAALADAAKGSEKHAAAEPARPADVAAHLARAIIAKINVPTVKVEFSNQTGASMTVAASQAAAR